jgi:transporter family-2 protein
MNIGLLGLILSAIVVGMAVPTQTGINIALGKALGNPFLSCVVSFGLGFLTVLVVLGIYMFSGQGGFPSAARLTEIPWWAWTGGFFGALFVTAALLLAPRLGATILFSLILAGQMLSSLIFDHFGCFDFPQRTISWLRLAGVLLVSAGVFLIQKF